jgi:putative oxidoreductase
METKLPIASLLLRFGLGVTLLSAVADRFGIWNEEVSSWGNWDAFLEYTATVNSFAPEGIIPFLAISATVLEIIIGILLIIGYKIRWAALGAALLTFMFALTMAYSFGVKSPLDYSVFVDCTAAFLLACIPNYKWSLDEFLIKQSI